MTKEFLIITGVMAAIAIGAMNVMGTPLAEMIDFTNVFPAPSADFDAKFVKVN